MPIPQNAERDLGTPGFACNASARRAVRIIDGVFRAPFDGDAVRVEAKAGDQLESSA